MKSIAVVDYSGHPFQIQLSKALAKNGFRIKHIYCSSFTTPKGNVSDNNIENYQIQGIELSGLVNKTNFVKRRSADIEFGHKLVQLLKEESYEKVILSNLPLDSLNIVTRFLNKKGVPYIYWLQDIYSIAMKSILKKKLPLVGHFIAQYYQRMERSALSRASDIVAITQDFIPILNDWKIETRKYVVPNWAPIDELPLFPKENDWSKKMALTDKKTILYSGTLGYKHNPDLLVRLSEKLDEKQLLLIISEGEVADNLKNHELHEKRFRVLPFQDFLDMPKILGTADLLVGVLEKDAGVFSVPSKVLTYLTASKPIVLSVPVENLASKLIIENNAGFSVDPDNENTFIEKCLLLINDDDLSRRMGQSGRSYAEKYFNISNIVSEFEQIINI